MLAFCAGFIFWCLCSLFYRFLDAFRGNDAAEWQKLEFVATLVLRTHICLYCRYCRDSGGFCDLRSQYLCNAVPVPVSLQLCFTGLTFADTNYSCPYWDDPKSPLIGGTLWPNHHLEFFWRCVLSATSVGEDLCIMENG